MDSLDAFGAKYQRGIKVADHGDMGARELDLHGIGGLSSGAKTKNVRELLFEVVMRCFLGVGHEHFAWKGFCSERLLRFLVGCLFSGPGNRVGLGEWSFLPTGLALWGFGREGEDLGSEDFPFPSIS